MVEAFLKRRPLGPLTPAVLSFVWPGGEVETLPLLPKTEVAARLLDRIEKLLGERG